MFLNLSDIVELQVDHTTRCNLQCPQCARTQDGWSKDTQNKNIDLSLNDYKILLSAFPENKISIFHCGNFGDAVASPTFDETFEYTLSKKPIKIKLTTNGALRSPDWWHNLALLGKERLFVTFAIDGLEDTNHIYRVGASWDKLVKNISSFIEAGGHARWDFIEFQHNSHQIKKAEQLAKELGFKKFNVKYTARFANQGIKSEQSVRGDSINDSPDNLNQKSVVDIKQRYGSFSEYVEKTPIICKYRKRRSMFIDMNMRLWPCCWFGAPPYLTTTNRQTPSFQYLFSRYGENFNNLRLHGWNVLEHHFFKKHLELSWQDPSGKYPRIYTCGRTCGQGFEFSSGYGKNSNIKNLNEGFRNDYVK